MTVGRGIIVSVIAGYYFVEADGEIWICRGRGKLRLNDLPPLAGDRVVFTPGRDGVGRIEAVLPRDNYLRRPAVANIDGVVVVLTPKSPAPSLLMVDKLLAQALAMGVEGIVCVNKEDLEPKGARLLARMYEDAGFVSLICSALTGDGIDKLGDILKGRTVVLAGQSGVGKSHIAGLIAKKQLELPLAVGKLSAKLGRGKHTTRQVSLLPLNGGGRLADTPGFSVFDLELESSELHRYFPEFQLGERCKFSPCYHIHEPGCAVKARLAENGISQTRYENYTRIFAELQEKEANRY